MTTFHNNPALKEELLTLVRIQESAPYADGPKSFQDRYGIPGYMAALIRETWGNLPKGHPFGVAVWETIPVGIDLQQIWPPFFHWLLSDFAQKQPIDSRERKAIERVRDLYAHGMPDPSEEQSAWLGADTALFAASSGFFKIEAYKEAVDNMPPAKRADKLLELIATCK